MSEGPSCGFTLIELIVALVVLEVGLLGCAGVLVLAQRRMAEAERLHVATQAAASAADSLLATGAESAGAATLAWGTLTWAPGPAVVRVRAADASGSPLLDWWIPRVGAR